MIKFFWREYWGYVLLILAIIGAVLMGIYGNDKNYWLLMGVFSFVFFGVPILIMAANPQEKSQPTRQPDKDVFEQIREIKERKERLDAMMHMTPRNRRKYIDDNDLF